MGKWKTVPAQAQEALEQASYRPRKLILLHTGVALGVTLVIALINIVLNRQMDAAGGLSGLGLRSVLGTIESVLMVVNQVVVPFWETGIFAAALLWAAGQPAEPASLLQGFRRFGPVLRLKLLQALLLVVLSSILMYPATILYMMTPWAGRLMEQMQPLMESAASAEEITTQLMELSMENIEPLIIICLVLIAAVALPLLFRMRFAPYLQMGKSRIGAIAAMAESFRMTRGNCAQLLKLDLQFWWFYVLQILTVVLCYGDLILTAWKIPQPWGETVGFFLFYGLGIAGQLTLYVFARPRVLTSYGMVCRQLSIRQL